MKHCKYWFLAVFLLIHPFAVLAQTWPEPGRELKLFVGFPPGSGADTNVRFFATKLAAISGHPVIVENRPGMLSSLAADAVAKAAPNGYTILLAGVSSSHGANTVLYKKLPYDPVKDFTPVTTLFQGTFLLMVNTTSPHRSVADLTAALRAAGSKASYGYGSPTALAASELYKVRAGLHAVGIAYKTSVASLPEMYSGALDFQFIDGTFGSAQMRAGKLRALAIASGERSSLLDMPTMAEAANMPDFDIAPWWAAFLPARAPQAAVTRLEGWFNQIVAMDETRKFLSANVAEPSPGNTKLLVTRLDRELRKWAELAKIIKFEQE
ncbi:MAG: Bug family tripartite tricarboxylate transporter substrate binding protein [Burkholderiales bacterium]